ncbi:helix-turn-helix transcriptional regulator [Aurantimonas sp. A2-1-M11]
MRGYRNYRGLSQSDLDKHLGVTFQQVQKYEKGVNRISGVRILEIAKLLGISVSTEAMLRIIDAIEGAWASCCERWKCRSEYEVRRTPR